MINEESKAPHPLPFHERGFGAPASVHEIGTSTPLEAAIRTGREAFHRVPFSEKQVWDAGGMRPSSASRAQCSNFRFGEFSLFDGRGELAPHGTPTCNFQPATCNKRFRGRGRE